MKDNKDEFLDLAIKDNATDKDLSNLFMSISVVQVMLGIAERNAEKVFTKEALKSIQDDLDDASILYYQIADCLCRDPRETSKTLMKKSLISKSKSRLQDLQISSLENVLDTLTEILKERWVKK